MSVLDRFKKGWTVFFGRDHPRNEYHYGNIYSDMPNRHRLITGSDRTIINTVYNRIALDCAAMKFRHIRQDEEGFYYPRMDESICIRCNKCNDVCPIINSSGDYPFPQRGYIIQNKDAQIRNISAAGGFFGLLCDYVYFLE